MLLFLFTYTHKHPQHMLRSWLDLYVMFTPGCSFILEIHYTFYVRVNMFYKILLLFTVRWTECIGTLKLLKFVNRCVMHTAYNVFFLYSLFEFQLVLSLDDTFANKKSERNSENQWKWNTITWFEKQKSTQNEVYGTKS